MINYEFPPIGGGAGHANWCLLRQYAHHPDMQVDLLTSCPGRGLTIDRFADNVRIYKVGIRKKNLHYWTKMEVVEWLLKARPLYLGLLQENAYDLAHAFFAFPSGWLCWRTAAQLPYLISLRGSDVPGYNVRLGLDYKLLAPLFRRIWSRASLITANSAGLCRLAEQFMPSLNIAVIPNGIDMQIYHPATHRETRGPIRLLSVGRLIARKRIDWLIEAVGAAVRQGLDVRLNIVGDGNLMSELKRKAAALNVAERVIFLGAVDRQRMPEVYRANDLFVMASRHEGMSNAMLEAIASGLPVLSTACEGVEELIGANGVIVGYPDTQEFVSAVRSIAADPDKYAAMSKAALAIAERFSWAAVAEQYMQLYRKLRS